MKAVKAVLLSTGLLSALAVATAAVKNSNFGSTESKSAAPEKNTGFAIVELFTSEGCSSCPPADALVETIQKNNNQDVYILAFHVDYWDHQGWKDKFSNRDFTNRQRQYASWLNLNTLYTPQVVVNGATEYVGSNSGPIQRAIASGLEQEFTKTLTLQGTVDGRKVTVGYQGDGDDKGSALVLALVQKSAQSNVRAGENMGRSLTHVQIVRNMTLVPLGMAGKKETVMDLPSDFTEKGWELIGYVQNKTDGRITTVNRFEFEPASTVSK